MSVQFNHTAVEEWVALCEEEGRLKTTGASAEVLETMRIRVAKALITLIQMPQTTALLEQILGTSQLATTTITSVPTEEVEDPSAG